MKNIFDSFRKIPLTTLAAIEKTNNINVQKIYSSVANNPSKAIVLDLSGYKIPFGGSYEIDLKYRWKLGAAFSGSLFHWWSNSSGELEMDLSKSSFITTMKHVDCLSIALNKAN